MSISFRGVMFDNEGDARWAMMLEFIEITWEYRQRRFELPPLANFSRQKFIDRHTPDSEEGRQQLLALADYYEETGRAKAIYTPDFWMVEPNGFLVILEDNKPDSMNHVLRLVNHTGCNAAVSMPISRKFTGDVMAVMPAETVEDKEQGICRFGGMSLSPDAKLVHDYTKLVLITNFGGNHADGN